jgi:hypothetical protein
MTSFILWVSRHDPIPAEREIIVKYPHSFAKGFVPTAEYLIKNYVEPLLKKYDKVYIIAILPESFKMRLLELIDDINYKDRVFVVEPLMKELIHSKDMQECMNIYKKDTNKYIMITYGNGKECKVFEFEKFVILKQYIKIYGEWEHEDR